ncbi:MAG: peptide ABC transporter substrate-binding protein [Synoicihabitans sp.]
MSLSRASFQLFSIASFLRPFGVALLGTALGILLSMGCAPRETRVEEGNRTGTLHVGSPGEPSELDPHIINAPPDFRIVPMLFENLVRGNPATLEPEPGIAESWTLSEDKTVYTFTIRPNAKWTNGDLITATDFLFSWERALTPALGSQYTFLFTDVVGADDFNAGRTADFSTVGFKAPDPRTVVIELKQPTPYFLANMANNAIWYPVHRATLESVGSVTDRSSGWTKPETIVSNGPFKLTSWRPNERIRLEKSESYWNADSVRLNALVYHAFDNPSTEELAFRAGQLHRTVWVPTAKLPGYREQSDSPLVEVDALIARFLNVNTNRPPFDDARVRRAFAMALDRDAIAKHVYLDIAVAARRVVPLGMPLYPTDEDFSDDQELARKLLAEAGYPNGDGFPQTELATEAGGSVNLPEAMQAQWREVLNVDVAILNSETRVHWDKLNRKDFTLAIGGWTADYPDATSYLDLWKTGSGYNFTNWTLPEYDQSLLHAARQKTPEERFAALRVAEGILMEHMPIIPLVFEKDVMLHHPSMQNFTPNAMDRPDYSTVNLMP